MDILSLRKKFISPSLSLSFDKPIHFVKGKGQYLYDIDGKRYLDAVNNIQHVGHCHPMVVDAARKQYGILNRNTRYLDENVFSGLIKRIDNIIVDINRKLTFVTKDRIKSFFS